MKYKKILLKLSGEALGSEAGSIKPEFADFIIAEIKEALDAGVKIAVVLGGGNIYRGNRWQEDGINEETAHWIGMLAITINCFAFADLIKKAGVPCETFSALGTIGSMPGYDIEKGKQALEEGKVVLLSGGTGKPFVTSDSGAAIRAHELGLDAIFKATKVDGVYDSDPVKNPKAKKFKDLLYMDALKERLKVMDSTALSLSMENNIPTVVFSLNEPGNIKRILMGETIGTRIG